MAITDNLIKVLLKSPQDHTFDNKTYKYIGKGGEGYIYKINDDVIKIYIKYNMDSVLKEFYITGILKELSQINFNIISIKDYYLSLSNPVMIMESMDGNLGDLTNQLIKTDGNNNNNTWLSIIFQSMIGFNFLNNRLYILHNDAKIKNILYKKNNNKNLGFKTYKINGITYNVPIDYICKISDFGFSQIIGSSLNNMSDDEIAKRIKEREDFRELSKIIERIVVNYMIKEYTYDQVLKMTSKYPEFEEIYKAQIISVGVELKSYPENIKKNYLFRFMCYYLVEHDHSYMETIKSKYKLNLPNQKIQNILNNIMIVDDPFKLFDMFIV